MAQTLVRETVVYTIDELKELHPRGYQKAMERLATSSSEDFGWYADDVIADAKRIGALFGIDARNVYYSGFWSQGDGACFEGSYSYVKGGLKALKKEVGTYDPEIVRIATQLQEVQRAHSYQLSATVTHSGHYSHEYCTSIDVTDNRDTWETTYTVPEDDVKELLRDFMRWIYRNLEREYEYRTSEDYLAQEARDLEHVFEESGHIYYQ